MKTRVNVYLSEEALELADHLAEEQNLSRSAIIDRRITQTQTPRADTNTNSPIAIPDGLEQSIKQIKDLLVLSTKLVDRQQELIVELIQALREVKDKGHNSSTKVEEKRKGRQPKPIGEPYEVPTTVHEWEGGE